MHHRDHFEAEMECSSCGHVWIEVAYYIGFGQYCYSNNEDLACPECGKTNEEAD